MIAETENLFALPPETECMRTFVRAFIARELESGGFQQPAEIGMMFNADFSRKVGKEGLIGLTWPKRYGGHKKSALERYVATEELLAASAPVGAHWVADRQSGPVLLKFGTEAQCEKYLPPITRGESYFCIGMSEPDSGSDLASLRSRADKVDDGWLINGRKVWTTNAHRAHYMVMLARTSSRDETARRAGFSQFIIDLTLPGVSVRPIINLTGGHDFNEVVLTDVLIGDDALIGAAGNGWNQVSAELAYERSGPERWLSSLRVLKALVRAYGAKIDETGIEAIGGLVGKMMALRRLSISIALQLERGAAPNHEAAMVKDMGTRFEQLLIRTCRDIALRIGPQPVAEAERLNRLLISAEMWSSAFTIRGGTVEILRGIIAKGLN